MKDIRSKNQLQNGNNENSNSNQQSSSNAGKKREDELLTTGGPVDRSAIDDGDRGFVHANSGIDMEHEESNQGNSSFTSGTKVQGGAKYGMAETSIVEKKSINPDYEDSDTSQDKTEGIVNPRTTLNDWTQFKEHTKSAGAGGSSGENESKTRGKNNSDPDSDIGDIAVV